MSILGKSTYIADWLYGVKESFENFFRKKRKKGGKRLQVYRNEVMMGWRGKWEGYIGDVG